MDYVRSIFVKRKNRNTLLEDENGPKPGVVFDDAGVQKVISLRGFCDEEDVITFTFSQGLLNDKGEISVQDAIKVYAGHNTFVNLSTGQVVPHSEALQDVLKDGYQKNEVDGNIVYIRDSDGAEVNRVEATNINQIKNGYITEFEFYINLFGKSSDNSASIYQMIDQFIQTKLSEGIDNYQPTV